jgi:hypothetical protein
VGNFNPNSEMETANSMNCRNKKTARMDFRAVVISNPG